MFESTSLHRRGKLRLVEEKHRLAEEFVCSRSAAVRCGVEVEVGGLGQA